MALTLEKNDAAVKIDAISKLFNTTNNKKEKKNNNTDKSKTEKPVDALVESKLSNMPDSETTKEESKTQVDVDLDDEEFPDPDDKYRIKSNVKLKSLSKSIMKIDKTVDATKKYLNENPELKSLLKKSKNLIGSGFSKSAIKNSIKNTLVDSALNNTQVRNAISFVNKNLCSPLVGDDKTPAIKNNKKVAKTMDKIATKAIFDIFACPINASTVTSHLLSFAGKMTNDYDPKLSSMLNGAALSVAKHEKIDFKKIGKNFLKTKTGKQLKKTIMTNAKVVGKNLAKHFKSKKDKKKSNPEDWAKDESPEMITKSSKPTNKPKSADEFTLADAIKDNVKTKVPDNPDELTGYTLSDLDKQLLSMGTMENKRESELLVG